MHKITKALKLSSILATSFVAWNADRLACATKNAFKQNDSGQQLDIQVIKSNDESAIEQAMKSRRPFIFQDGDRTRGGLHKLTPERLAEQDEALNVCVAPVDGTFSYGSEIFVHMSPREFVDRVFHGRQTTSMLYLRYIDSSIVRHEVRERIGDYQYMPNSNNVFISQAGCVTRLHNDAGHGFLTQFKGTKKIVLFAPDQAYNLYENPLRFVRRNEFSKLPQNDCMQANPDIFKRLARTDRFEGSLQSGDTLYIPAYWWHQVTSLTPSISGVVMYQLHKNERILARSFTGKLREFVHRTGFVNKPVPKQYISRDLGDYYLSSAATRMNTADAELTSEAIYDLDKGA
jgi:hypothetical protein